MKTYKVRTFLLEESKAKEIINAIMKKTVVTNAYLRQVTKYNKNNDMKEETGWEIEFITTNAVVVIESINEFFPNIKPKIYVEETQVAIDIDAWNR